jgi:hypothetical protein
LGKGLIFFQETDRHVGQTDTNASDTHETKKDFSKITECMQKATTMTNRKTDFFKAAVLIPKKKLCW